MLHFVLRRRVLLLVAAGLMVAINFVPRTPSLSDQATLDPGFGSGGIVTTALSDTQEIHGLAIDPSNNKIVAAGVVSTGDTFHAAVVRYGANGGPDIDFGSPVLGHDGVSAVQSNIGPGVDVGNVAAVGKAGKIVVAGYTSDIHDETDYRQLFVSRYLQNGEPDTDFGIQGVFLAPSAFRPRAMTIDPSGNILIAGLLPDERISTVVVIRLTDSGQLDSTGFGYDGYTTVAARADALTLDQLASTTSVPSSDSFDVLTAAQGIVSTLRYDSASKSLRLVGSVATGSNILSRISGVGRVKGGFMLAGTLSNRFAVARYSLPAASGTQAQAQLDPKFGDAGTYVLPQTGDGDSAAFAVLQQQDGQILAAGRSGDSFALLRFMGDLPPPTPTATPTTTAAAPPPARPAASLYPAVGLSLQLGLSQTADDSGYCPADGQAPVLETLAIGTLSTVATDTVQVSFSLSVPEVPGRLCSIMYPPDAGSLVSPLLIMSLPASTACKPPAMLIDGGACALASSMDSTGVARDGAPNIYGQTAVTGVWQFAGLDPSATSLKLRVSRQIGSLPLAPLHEIVLLAQ